MPPFSYTLAQHLELTYLEYEALRHEFYIDWCVHLLRRGEWQFALTLKTLLINDHLLNWYAQQWHIQVERPIEQNYSDALSLYTPEDIHLLILIYAENILQYYPSVLLKLAVSVQANSNSPHQV